MVDCALRELLEVRSGPRGELDAAGFVAKQANLGDGITAWFPEFDDLCSEIDPLLIIVDVFDGSSLILAVEVTLLGISLFGEAVPDAAPCFVKWYLILTDKRVEFLFDIVLREVSCRWELFVEVCGFCLEIVIGYRLAEYLLPGSPGVGMPRVCWRVKRVPCVVKLELRRCVAAWNSVTP